MWEDKEEKGQKDPFVEKIGRYMRQEQMAPAGCGIVAGVSGGADSVCLLLVLSRLARREGWKLAVAHVNHRIRREAGEDAEYVREMCAALGIPFFLKEADVEKLAAEWGCSVEEAGRRVRYETFEEAAAETGAGRIAVAHNRSDRAETLLFHMFRGTGLAGMASIRPVRGNVIRPLLDTGREEIEAWLKRQSVRWCIDSSNDTDTYTRNRIRHHILPYAREEICPEAELHLSEEAQLLTQTADFVDRLTRQALRRCARQQDGRFLFDAEAFLGEEPFLAGHMLKLALGELTGGGRDISRRHILDIQALFGKQSGRRIMLPGGLEAVREPDRVVLGRRKEWAEDEPPRPVELLGKLSRDGRAGVFFPGLGRVELELQTWEKSREIPEKKYTKWMDYDKIKGSPCVRTRKQGDYLVVNSAGGRKKLNRVFIDEKIPAGLRDQIPVVAAGSEILWIPGGRMNEQYKITSTTGRVLELHYQGGVLT